MFNKKTSHTELTDTLLRDINISRAIFPNKAENELDVFSVTPNEKTENGPRPTEEFISNTSKNHIYGFELINRNATVFSWIAPHERNKQFRTLVRQHFKNVPALIDEPDIIQEEDKEKNITGFTVSYTGSKSLEASVDTSFYNSLINEINRSDNATRIQILFKQGDDPEEMEMLMRGFVVGDEPEEEITDIANQFHDKINSDLEFTRHSTYAEVVNLLQKFYIYSFRKQDTFFVKRHTLAEIAHLPKQSVTESSIQWDSREEVSQTAPDAVNTERELDEERPSLD